MFQHFYVRYVSGYLFINISPSICTVPSRSLYIKSFPPSSGHPRHRRTKIYFLCTFSLTLTFFFFFSRFRPFPFQGFSPPLTTISLVHFLSFQLLHDWNGKFAYFQQTLATALPWNVHHFREWDLKFGPSVTSGSLDGLLGEVIPLNSSNYLRDSKK